MMKKILGWLVFIPVAAVIMVLSVANRDLVTLEAWPLPFSYELPVYLLILVAVFIGIFWGGLGAWWAAGKARSTARVMTWRFEAAEREIRALEKEVMELNGQTGQSEGQAKGLLKPKTLSLPRSKDAA